MPFQDIDEAAEVEVPKPPSAIERLLRRIFVEDLSLKVLALGITLIIWFAVTGENKPITIRTGVQLNFLRAENLEVSNDPPKTVDVLLTGSRNKLNSIKLPDLVATVDLRDSRAGERVIRLSPKLVSIELPEGVKIESFQPNSLALRLEPRVERQVPVEVRLDGKPAEGHEVYGTQLSLSMVRVHGPASHVHNLQRAPTETISVEGRKESFTVPHAAIDISDQKVEVLDPAVDVIVEIGLRRSEKSFDSVSVRSRTGAAVQPSTATVTVSGAADAIDKLRREDIVVIVDPSSSSESAPRLELPPGLQHQVWLVSIRPTVFH
jgi:YbbR domain-containing protein